MNNRGKKYELIALNYLLSFGLTHIASNFYSRFGEIDIIMFDDIENTFIFFEIKYRKNGIQNAAESITPSKQQKIIYTASYFIAIHGNSANYRIDAILISPSEIMWLKNIIS